MVSREHKKAVLHEKLELLRSITNSHAKNDSSIILDASKYIQELKHKVQILNNDIERGQTSSSNSWPVVRVEAVEKAGIQVNLYSERSCPGLLVFVLKVFEKLGLNVLEARVSCTGTFHLQALLGVESDENGESIDARMVKQEISNAIETWGQKNDHQG